MVLGSHNTCESPCVACEEGFQSLPRCCFHLPLLETSLLTNQPSHRAALIYRGPHVMSFHLAVKGDSGWQCIFIQVLMTLLDTLFSSVRTSSYVKRIWMPLISLFEGMETQEGSITSSFIRGDVKPQILLCWLAVKDYSTLAPSLTSKENT